MNAKITYRLGRIPHPFNKEKRGQGMEAMCLIKVTTYDLGTFPEEMPVAIFDLDSEADRFAAHVFLEKLNGKLVSIDRDTEELLKYRLEQDQKRR